MCCVLFKLVIEILLWKILINVFCNVLFILKVVLRILIVVLFVLIVKGWDLLWCIEKYVLLFVKVVFWVWLFLLNLSCVFMFIVICVLLDKFICCVLLLVNCWIVIRLEDDMGGCLFIGIKVYMKIVKYVVIVLFF